MEVAIQQSRPQGETIYWDGNPYTEAIGTLYREYNTRIYNFVYVSLGRSSKDAEEVTQDVWVAVLKGYRRFKGNSSIYTWIHSITQHKIRDWQRKNYQNITRQSLDNDESPLEAEDTGPRPEKTTETLELREALYHAMGNLPVHYQQALTLKYIEDLSSREIGQVLGKSQKSIESLLDRARLAMRTEYPGLKSRL